MTELEIMTHAKHYVDMLASGIDPISESPVTQDSVLCNPRMSKCFSYISGILAQVIANGGEIGKKSKTSALPFTITQEQKSCICISEEPIGIMLFAKRVAEVLDSNVKNLSAPVLTAWCVHKGLLREETFNNKTRKVCTPLGNQIGITTVEGVSASGVPYKKNIYNAQAQQYLMNHLEEIARDTQD